ncbi:hypothetical protein ABIE44_000934 [Marmoricola sp. OAE513]|uniref:hypothetical protein n=1 Tax=Marmoricola sp. OAE513 TaxID=2817894 RepID=UPI001AEACCA6
MATSRRFSLDWWLRDDEGHLVVAQVPNPAIGVWMATVVLGWSDLLNDADQRLLTTLGRGALLAWAADEVLRGSAPFRRVLGLVVGTFTLVHLFG